MYWCVGLCYIHWCIARYSCILRSPWVFDSIPHEMPLNLSLKTGIRGLTLQPFRSYSTERIQMVRLNNICRRRLKVKIEISQKRCWVRYYSYCTWIYCWVWIWMHIIKSNTDETILVTYGSLAVCSFVHVRPDLKPFLNHSYTVRNRKNRLIIASNKWKKPQH